MWQKAHPVGLRVGIVRSWLSEWHSKTKRQNSDFVVEDMNLRKFIEEFYPRAGVGRVVIRKTTKEWEIIIFASKVGVVMGKDGSKIQELENKIEKKFGKTFKVTIKAIKVPELSAKIMAEHVATQLEARMPFRKVAKQIIKQIMDKGAVWVKIKVWWRLWGVDIARKETFNDGRVPLQTLRADIDYHDMQAHTKYGVLGVKVWIAKGEIFAKKSKQSLMKEIVDKLEW